MRAQASFHANDARWQLLERVFETQTPDPPSKSDLPVSREADEVKYFLANVDADNCQWRSIGLRLRFHYCFSC
jgi:hypothetical protein